MRVQVKGRPGSPVGQLVCGTFQCPVALGKNGVRAAADKRESDGCTPLGTYRILYGLYRPDRVAAPINTGVVWLPLTSAMGWGDAPHDPAYNSLVPVGYGASHERLWREDTAYDRLLVIGHNLPAVPGMGSAIFIHQLHAGKAFTAGCVALAAADFTAMLAQRPTQVCIQQ
ncbi:MAG: L,D-transpeptidase family protein [Alphaproteobacteria bacterium]|nr:L,D-transpeptidase family protein [Alphaproteobacteria bacterium]